MVQQEESLWSMEETCWTWKEHTLSNETTWEEEKQSQKNHVANSNVKLKFLPGGNHVSLLKSTSEKMFF